MKCPVCDADMTVTPFGKNGAQSARCSDAACKTYFVIPKNTKEKAAHVPPPKAPAPSNDPRDAPENRGLFDDVIDWFNS